MFPLFFICFCHFDFISFMPFVFALKVCRNLSLKFILVKIMESDCFTFLFNLMKLINYFEGIFRGSGIIVPLCFVFLIAYRGPERRLNGKEVLGGFEVV